ncbi:MAG: TatD family hydrolase [Clostridia bacterium]|nr:TatD family hydrolase [Clostridia bacterium]
MLFDTHTHLDDKKFDNDRDDVISSLKEQGISLAVNVGADIKSSKESILLAEKYDFIYASVGVHPCDTKDLTDDDLSTLEKMAHHKKVVAIGEIGLDYYWDEPEREIQKDWFLKQLLLAKKHNMPYIVHDRDAHADTLEIIKKADYTNGVMHCFSGSNEMAKEVVKMGMYVSLSGTVTFKNAKTAKEVAKAVPIDRLLIETDSPYLTPEPFRGKRNNSAYVKYTLEEIAKIRGISTGELARITLENGKRFYNIK